jgi:hypothetical protein
MVPEPSLPSNIAAISTIPTMASSSTTLMATTLMLMSQKLVRTNHTLWKAQVLVVLWGAQLARFLDESAPTPEEKLKIQKDKLMKC